MGSERTKKTSGEGGGCDEDAPTVVRSTTMIATVSMADNYHLEEDDDVSSYEVNSTDDDHHDGQHHHHDHSVCGDDDHDTNSKEYNHKKLLVSLGMLLPAVAAIIGVMAWAISAEVVLGAKRQTERQQQYNNYLKSPSNRYDYTRFTSAPPFPLPNKEMLIGGQIGGGGNSVDYSNGRIDPASSNNVNNFNLLALGEMMNGKRLIERRHDAAAETASPISTEELEKIKNRLMQENIAQIIEKLFNNHQKSSNGKNPESKNSPRIVVVAPIASQSSSSSSSSLSSSSLSSIKNGSKKSIGNGFSEPKVTTSKPKSYELKISSSHQGKSQENNRNNQNQIKVPAGKSGSTSGGNKNRKMPSNENYNNAGHKKSMIRQQQQSHKQIQQSNESKRSKSNQSAAKHVQQHQQQQSNEIGKNPKTRTYEKQIDSLLQKIEKLEKQKLAQQPKPKPMMYERKPPSNVIAEKIKKFMESAPAIEETTTMAQHHHQEQPAQQPAEPEASAGSNPWEAMMPPPLPPPPPIPPPMPPMPFMPYMPPMQPVVQPDPQPNPVYNEVVTSPQQYQQPQYPQPQQSQAYYSKPDPFVQQPAPALGGNYQTEYRQQQSYPASSTYQSSYQEPQQYQNRHQQHQSQASNNVNSYAYPPESQYQPPNEEMMNEFEQPLRQRPGRGKHPENDKSSSIFGRRFQLSKIFTSVLPKSKKVKKEEPKSRPRPRPRPRPEPVYQEQPPPPPPPPPSAHDSMAEMSSQYEGQMSAPPQSYSGGGDPMTTSESRYKSRGYPMEAAGMQVRFGGGPMGGGSQVKVNPMAILKTIAMPLMRKPAMNLNGKVVFGVVLENGVGGSSYGSYGRYKKPKTVFQHYSTGRIKRR